ncbi:Outer membrane protein beta-barrel domain-containing protein [Formosa sp. Hel1_31_208]|uniref:porin family protein n=1 Tax=Formosa sp. Hel1_31_208 TaxID=1798225 RepID=UPI000879F5DE|nr:porin family protein [Formosa sp. Hel1_31_208]SDS27613.1 Outer membrane protein beta-barrel domain-containing protein [Formosa sp. Hel1_31_208]
MKKLLVCLFVTVFALAFVNAQNTNESVKFGAKAGVNFSDITGDDADSFKGRTSFHVGGAVEIPISESFSIQPEILYSSQGSDWEEMFEGMTFSGTVKADFLNVPIMAKYYVVEGLSIEAGPQVGILLSAKEETEGEEVDIKDDLKGIDFGVNFGLGYQLDNGINFAARYNLGLSDLNDNPDFLGESSYKNSVIQLSVGYFFQ